MFFQKFLIVGMWNVNYYIDVNFVWASLYVYITSNLWSSRCLFASKMSSMLANPPESLLFLCTHPLHGWPIWRDEINIFQLEAYKKKNHFRKLQRDSFVEINLLCAPNLIFLLIFAENIHLLPLRCKIKKDLLLLFIVAHWDPISLPNQLIIVSRVKKNLALFPIRPSPAPSLPTSQSKYGIYQP